MHFTHFLLFIIKNLFTHFYLQYFTKHDFQYLSDCVSMSIVILRMSKWGSGMSAAERNFNANINDSNE